MACKNMEIENKANSERGSSTTLALLFCLTALGVYLKGGRDYLLANYPHELNLTVFLGLIVSALFTLGCSLNMILLGGKTHSQIKRDLRRQIEELSQFINDATKRLRDYEILARKHCLEIHPQSLESLGRNRRILHAMRERVLEAQALLQSSRTLDLIEAHEILNQDLHVAENYMETLIQTDPIAPIKPNLWMATVEEMFQDVEGELERVAA